MASKFIKQMTFNPNTIMQVATHDDIHMYDYSCMIITIPVIHIQCHIAIHTPIAIYIYKFCVLK